MSDTNDIIACWSSNYDVRSLPISMVVLHYTGMQTCAEALERLADSQAKVSAHYLIDEAGQAYALVPEDKRAWHAGIAYWRGIRDVNSASIGIELANRGHEFGYTAFPEAQIARLISLLHEIKERYAIKRGDVVGHSDVAPARKRDPGELFPWPRLARLRLALPRPSRKLTDPLWSDAGFILALERFGYDVTDELAAVVAFQRRFRPELIDGHIDGECRALLLALLLPQPS